MLRGLRRHGDFQCTGVSRQGRDAPQSVVKHEALETAQLWVKLHKHGYHCTKQDVSRFRFRRKNGSLHVARPEDGDVHAKVEAEYKARWEAQRAVEKAKSERRAAERAAEMAFLEQQAAAEQAAKEKAAAEKAASEAAAQKAATVATIEAAADKAAERVVAARLSSRALVLAHACESAAESPKKSIGRCGRSWRRPPRTLNAVSK